MVYMVQTVSNNLTETGKQNYNKLKLYHNKAADITYTINESGFGEDTLTTNYKAFVSVNCVHDVSNCVSDVSGVSGEKLTLQLFQKIDNDFYISSNIQVFHYYSDLLEIVYPDPSNNYDTDLFNAKQLNSNFSFINSNGYTEKQKEALQSQYNESEKKLKELLKFSYSIKILNSITSIKNVVFDNFLKYEYITSFKTITSSYMKKDSSNIFIKMGNPQVSFSANIDVSYGLITLSNISLSPPTMDLNTVFKGLLHRRRNRYFNDPPSLVKIEKPDWWKRNTNAFLTRVWFVGVDDQVNFLDGIEEPPTVKGGSKRMRKTIRQRPKKCRRNSKRHKKMFH